MGRYCPAQSPRSNLPSSRTSSSFCLGLSSDSGCNRSTGVVSTGPWCLLSGRSSVVRNASNCPLEDTAGSGWVSTCDCVFRNIIDHHTPGTDDAVLSNGNPRPACFGQPESKKAWPHARYDTSSSNPCAVADGDIASISRSFRVLLDGLAQATGHDRDVGSDYDMLSDCDICDRRIKHDAIAIDESRRGHMKSRTMGHPDRRLDDWCCWKDGRILGSEFAPAGKSFLDCMVPLGINDPASND